MTNLQNQEWYTQMVDDCRAIITERVTNSKIELITGYAEVGERIYNDKNYQKYGKGNQAFIEGLFRDIGIGKSTGYKCLQFYEKFILPHGGVSNGLQSLPEGKNISWYRICNKYLPESNGESVKEDGCDHEKLMCVHCHKTFTWEEIKNDRNSEK